MQQLVERDVDPPAREQAAEHQRQADPPPIEAAIQAVDRVEEGTEHSAEGGARHGVILYLSREGRERAGALDSELVL